jgi:hypothetical protein
MRIFTDFGYLLEPVVEMGQISLGKLLKSRKVGMAHVTVMSYVLLCLKLQSLNL